MSVSLVEVVGLVPVATAGGFVVVIGGLKLLAGMERKLAEGSSPPVDARPAGVAAPETPLELAAPPQPTT